jgi:hypothetical protein
MCVVTSLQDEASNTVRSPGRISAAASRPTIFYVLNFHEASVKHVAMITMLLTVAREERAQVGKLNAINMTLFYCVYTGCILFH